MVVLGDVDTSGEGFCVVGFHDVSPFSLNTSIPYVFLASSSGLHDFCHNTGTILTKEMKAHSIRHGHRLLEREEHAIIL